MAMLSFGGIDVSKDWLDVMVLSGCPLIRIGDHGFPEQPPAVAPAPVVVPTWTGFYIGVHGGAAWQSTPNWTFFDPNGALVALPINGGNPALGGVGGFQAGYNWQFAPSWVVGVEGDISW